MIADLIEKIILSPIFLGAAGGTVGVGIMIIMLARWSRKLLGLDSLEAAAKKVDTCPYAADHPALQKFMGSSMQDRSDMRDFLNSVSDKVDDVSSDVGRIEGKLDVLLQGARVRWNSGLIPPTGGNKT